MSISSLAVDIIVLGFCISNSKEWIFPRVCGNYNAAIMSFGPARAYQGVFDFIFTKEYIIITLDFRSMLNILVITIVTHSGSLSNFLWWIYYCEY